MQVLYIPFLGDTELGWLAYPITVFWLVGITNAINLIDGLDGLSAGISSIVLATHIWPSLAHGYWNSYYIATCINYISKYNWIFILQLPSSKNFHGRYRSTILGYCISVISLLGLYKSVTLFSFIVPIIILGVPIFDTIFAIIRRIVNKTYFSTR